MPPRSASFPRPVPSARHRLLAAGRPVRCDSIATAALRTAARTTRRESRLRCDTCPMWVTNAVASYTVHFCSSTRRNECCHGVAHFLPLDAHGYHRPTIPHVHIQTYYHLHVGGISRVGFAVAGAVCHQQCQVDVLPLSRPVVLMPQRLPYDGPFGGSAAFRWRARHRRSRTHRLCARGLL